MAGSPGWPSKRRRWRCAPARATKSSPSRFPPATGTIANPTLVAAAGASVRVELVNALAEPTIVHWHGLTMDTRNDGNGEALIAPGERYDYAFQLRNRAGLYWYHPHPHGATATQIYRGLFGLIEVTDDDERIVRKTLDLVPGSTELTLVVQDRRVGDGDRYAPAPEDELLGWYGCQPHVNGSVRPYHDIAARRYRLRFAQCFELRERTGSRSVAQCQCAPVRPDRHRWRTARNEAFVAKQVLLSPAERVDILVDFADVAKGGFVILESRAFDPMHAVPATSVVRDEQAASEHGHRADRTVADEHRRERLRSHAVPDSRGGRRIGAGGAGTLVADADLDCGFPATNVRFAWGSRRDAGASTIVSTTAKRRRSRWRAAPAKRGCCATITRAPRTRCICTVSSSASSSAKPVRNNWHP
jgi:FtsP/CotA-like multicopper oxidase with cupredoxin domain